MSTTKGDRDTITTNGIDGHLHDGREAPLKLHFLVIGCGLGGLAAAHCLATAGHTITLLESARAIGEVGAGIQVSPNVSRLLQRWGLGEKLEACAVEPEAIVFRRYEDGRVVGRSTWGVVMRTRHGAPYYHVHRADLHGMVYDLVRDGRNPRVQVRLNATVTSINPTPSSGKVSVTLSSGEVVWGDVIVGADGVKSVVRSVVVGKADNAEPTGDAAYRAIIPTDVMLQDPDLRPFVDHPEMTAWMGPRRHVMCYCIRDKKEYNLVMLHPDDGSVESWTAEGSAEQMRADFADYDPRIRKLLSFVDSTLKWRLMDRQPLETWVHPDGRVALLGDACHPMLPYRAQGAAMAFEDASILGSLFSHLTHPAQIAYLLHSYESLRLTRTARTQASSRRNQKIFHLPDGPTQENRDASMRAAIEIEDKFLKREGEGGWDLEGLLEETKGNPNQWADQSLNIEQFSYDADEEAERWYREEGERRLREIENAAVAVKNGDLNANASVNVNVNVNVNGTPPVIAAN